jgi:hypothetical protein
VQNPGGTSGAGRGGGGMTETQARQRVIQEAEIVCATLSSCIATEFLDTELKFDVRFLFKLRRFTVLDFLRFCLPCPGCDCG